jgi:hypothetical protein
VSPAAARGLKGHAPNDTDSLIHLCTAVALLALVAHLPIAGSRGAVRGRVTGAVGGRVIR